MDKQTNNLSGLNRIRSSGNYMHRLL